MQAKIAEKIKELISNKKFSNAQKFSHLEKKKTFHLKALMSDVLGNKNKR